jgi:hypothetical protein
MKTGSLDAKKHKKTSAPNLRRGSPACNGMNQETI